MDAAPAAATLDQQKQQLRLIWTALFGAVLLYGAACYLVVGSAEPAATDATTEWLHNGFTFAGIIVGAASIWWRRRFLSTDPAPAGADAGIPFAQLQTHSVIVWTLCDAVAVCGVVLAVVVRSFQEFVPFGVAGAALLVMHHPFRLPFDRIRATAV